MLIGREYNFHAKDPFAAKCKRLRNRNLVWKEKLMSGLRRCQRLRHGRPAREQDQSPPPCASRLVLPPFTSTDSSFTQEEKEKVVGWLAPHSCTTRFGARASEGELPVEGGNRRRHSTRQYERRFERARKEGSERGEGLPSHHCSNQDNTFSAVIVAAAAAM